MFTDDLEEIGQPANPVDKPGYRLEFGDDFEKATLNTDRWLPFYLPQWSSRQLAAARYSLPGSCLRLHIEKDQPPWCPDHDGLIRVSSLQTGCYSGPLNSQIGQHRFTSALSVREPQATSKLYTPKYGYFEVRLKAVPIPGYMVAFWMIGFEEGPEESGEICVCEIFGKEVANRYSTVGYGIRSFYDPRLTNDFHHEVATINAASYHIYSAEWTPSCVKFFIDNIKLGEIQQSPDYPMQFMLGIYEIPDQLTDESMKYPWPKVMEVDYVRGYQPHAGY